MSFISYFMMIIMVAGGSRGGMDLMDLTNTDSYWQLKHVTVTVDQLKTDAGPDAPVANIDAVLKDLQSADFATRDKAKSALESMGAPIIAQLKPAMDSKDPEVAAVVSDLVKRFSERGQERAIRRLMAIRTLGERKEKDALPLLKTLVDSKELFVSDYALRAIAQIEGKQLEAIDHQKEFAQDVNLLPKELSILLQTKTAGGDEQFLDKFIDQTIEAMKLQGADMPPEMLKKLDKAQVRMAITRRILSLVEKVGNIRMEGATIGVSDSIGGDGGWAIINLRGKYNAALVYEALKPLEQDMAADPFTQPATRPAKAAPQPGDIPQINMGYEGYMLLPSNDSMIMVMGERKELDAALKTTIAAIKAGKGTFGENADFAAQMKTIDLKSTAWGIMRPNEAIKKLGFLAAFDTVTVEAIRTKEGNVTYTFKGEGTEADKVKAAVDELTNDIKDATNSIQQVAAQEKYMLPVVDFFQSMKVAAADKKASLTGELKPSLMQALLMTMGGPSMLMYFMEDEPQNGAGVDHNPIVGERVVEPAQPVLPPGN